MKTKACVFPKYEEPLTQWSYDKLVEINMAFCEELKAKFDFDLWSLIENQFCFHVKR